MRDSDLDRLLMDAERVLEDDGVESFMEEGPNLIASLARAVRDLRSELTATRVALANTMMEGDRG